MTNASHEGKRPTLEDVAARAGVSRALVSLVIRGAPGASDQTRQRVLAVAAEIGYRPDSRAQLLARRRSRLLGVMFWVHQPFHADLLEGIYQAAEPTGYELALSALAPSRDERRAVESLLNYRCEALILLGPQTPESRLADLARELPVVAVARHVHNSAVRVVRTSDEDGVRLAVEHLLSLGHRSIVHVDGRRALGAPERRGGYRTIMRRLGLADQIRIVPGGLTEESGAVAAQILLDSAAPLPSAILAFNDRCAVGLLGAFTRANIAIPADVSLIGFDDDRLTRLPYINLTTVRQDATLMATLAVDAALARIHGTDLGDRETVLPPELVIRGTTCAAGTPPRPGVASHPGPCR